MGLISALTGLGSTLRDAGSLAEVFVGNKRVEDEDQHAEFIAALNQLGAEFSQPKTSVFDSIIDGLNRLPRPALALGTLGLFVYAMADPVGFAGRMQGLQLVPEPMWWLLGAIVSFYFGSRELHYFRSGDRSVSVEDVIRVNDLRGRLDRMRPRAPEIETPPPGNATDPDYNAALAEWRALQQGA